MKELNKGKTISFRNISDPFPRLGEIILVALGAVVVITAEGNRVCVSNNRIYKVF